MRRIILLAAFAVACWAQPSQVVIVPGSPPGGAGAACTDHAHGYLATTGVIYTCQSSTWQSQGGGGGGTPGGSNTQVQFNDGGSTFGGNSGFTFNKTTGAVAIGTTVSGGIYNLVPVSEPATPPAASATGTAGLPSGTYYYAYTYTTSSHFAVLAYQETSASTCSGSVVAASKQVSVTGITASSDPRVTGRRVYRTTNPDCSAFQFLGSIANNTATTFTDNIADGAIDQTPDNSTIAFNLGGSPWLTYTEAPGGFCDNLVIGRRSGTGFTSNSDFSFCGNVFLGSDAGTSTQVGNGSIGIGAGALTNNTTGLFNVAIGAFAGNQNLTGSGNTWIGNAAGWGSSDTGSNETCIGSNTCNNGPTTGDNNTAVGSGSLTGLTSGASNTGAGASACATISTGTGNVCLGHSSGPTTNQSAKLFIDNGQSDAPLIGGDFSARRVQLTGGSANTVVCWGADGRTIGYATVAEITSGTCHTP